MQGRALSPLTVVVVLTFIAVSTRLVPLAISSYPFNNDGITLSRIASDIISTGNLQYPDDASYFGGHGTITPAFSIVLAYVASVLGLTPFEVAQTCVGIFSSVTIIGGYVIALAISRSQKGAIAAALFLSLFGTFVFLSGSVWNASLGVALMVLLILSYMLRSQKRMLALAVLLLFTLVIVHHLVTFFAYLIIVYLTAWSVYSAFRGRSFGKRHVIDLSIVVFPSIGAFAYYSVTSLNRLSNVVDGTGMWSLGFAFLVTLAVAILILRRKKSISYTLAPIPSILVLALYSWDYFHPIFPYAPGLPPYVLIIGFVYSAVLFFAWLGWESSLGTESLYRAVPLALILPAVVLAIFVIVSGFSLEGHQILYRTFDFVGVALAVGIAVCVARLSRRPRAQLIAVAIVLSSLVVSFPFAYATETLTGIRRDTQEYEVDCLDWIDGACGHLYWVETDERLAYNGRALYDLNTSSILPLRLEEQRPHSPGTVYVYLEEWADQGVNDYPEGYMTPDKEYVDSVLGMSSVLYVGGPADNSVIIYRRPGPIL